MAAQVERGWRLRIGTRGIEFVSAEGRIPAKFGRGAVGKFLVPYSKHDLRLLAGSMYHSGLRCVVPDSFYGRKNALGAEGDAVRGVLLRHVTGHVIEVLFTHRPAPDSLVQAMTRAFNQPPEERQSNAEGKLALRAVPQEDRPAEAEGPGLGDVEVEQVRGAEAEGRADAPEPLTRVALRRQAFEQMNQAAGVPAPAVLPRRRPRRKPTAAHRPGATSP